MKLPLTDEERRSLTDTGALAHASAAGGLRLEGRIVSGIAIPDLVFERAVFRDVDFQEVELAGTRFRGARLEGVSFSECQLDATVFEESELARCAIQRSQLVKARLERCQVRDLQTTLCEFRELAVEECRIEGWKDERGEFARPLFRRMTVAAPAWDRTRMSYARFDQVIFGGGRLERVALSENQAKGLAFRDVTLGGLEILFGDLDEVLFERLGGHSLVLGDLSARSVRIAASELAHLTLSGVRAASVVLDACPSLASLMVMYSELNGLHASKCGLTDLAIRHSHVAGPSALQACQIAGLDLEESRIEDLSIADSSFEGAVHLPKATLQRLRLERVIYGDSVEVIDDGAVYEGDAFPGKKG